MISDHPLPHVASQAFRPGHSGPDPETSTQIIVVHVHQQGSKEYKKLRKAIKDLKEILMATKDEVLADLNAIQSTVAQIGVESAASLARIVELEALVAAGGVSQEIVDKLAEVKAQVKIVDDMVPTPVPPIP